MALSIKEGAFFDPSYMYNELTMISPNQFPRFDERLPYLDQFVLELVDEFKEGKLNSWDDLDELVNAFFTTGMMEQTCSIIPHWEKMASYSNGITLVHTICVFMGIFVMPEFHQMTKEQQQAMKWAVLFHDIEKEPQSHKRDALHPLKSAISAGNTLPGIGFPVTNEYHQEIETWSEQTAQAFFTLNDDADPKPDNSKLPEILAGIDSFFGENTPANLITKTVLLHNSINVDPNYPTPSPLTEDEIKGYITPGLFPLLKVMMLGDNEGWSLFQPEIRARQRRDTLEVYNRLGHLLSI